MTAALTGIGQIAGQIAGKIGCGFHGGLFGGWVQKDPKFSHPNLPGVRVAMA